MLLASRALPCKERFKHLGCNVKVVHSRARGALILGVGRYICLEERYGSYVLGRFGKGPNSNMSEGALVWSFGKYLLSNHGALALPSASTCGLNIPIILVMPNIPRDLIAPYALTLAVL